MVPLVVTVLSFSHTFSVLKLLKYSLDITLNSNRIKDEVNLWNWIQIGLLKSNKNGNIR